MFLIIRLWRSVGSWATKADHQITQLSEELPEHNRLQLAAQGRNWV